MNAFLSSLLPPVFAKPADGAVHVEAGSIKAGQNVVVLLHSGKKALVAVGVEVCRIGAAADQAERLVTKTAQQRVVASGLSGTHRVLDTQVDCFIKRSGFDPANPWHTPSQSVI